MIIDILGTPYTYEEHDPQTFAAFQSNDGLCKPYDKEIYVRKKEFHAGSSDEAKFNRYKHVITHELVHAFMEESGRAYEDDEFLTDWIATMVPKISDSVNIILKASDEEKSSTNKISLDHGDNKIKKCPSVLSEYYYK